MLPSVFQRLSLEQIKNGLEQDVIAEYPAYSQLRDTDPIRVLVDTMAGYFHISAAFYDARLTSVFLSTAVGSDLNAIADLFSVTRISGESDASLRVRVRTAISNITPVGSVLRNSRDAFAASDDVHDVSFGVSANLQSQVYLLSTATDPAPTTDLKNTVLDYLRDDTRRRVDQIWTAPDPTITNYYVAATVDYDDTTTTESAVSGLVDTALETECRRQLKLGGSITQLGIYLALSAVSGVSDVQLTRLTTSASNTTEVVNINNTNDDTAYWCPVANRAITYQVAV